MINPLSVVLTLGAAELLNAKATEADVAESLAPLPRDAVIRYAVRIINSMALDRRLSEERDLVELLPASARLRLTQYERQTVVRVYHPFQQLVLIHAASRFCSDQGDRSLSIEQMMRRWALCSLQINDLLMRAEIPTRIGRAEKALFVFAEEAARWELMNPSPPNQAIARLRALVVSDIPQRGSTEHAAAARIRERFVGRLNIDFDLAFNLTAFLVYWWRVQARGTPSNPDASTIAVNEWLVGSNISIEQQQMFLSRLSMTAAEITHAFSSFQGKWYHELVPFRRRPILKIDESHFAFLCPQFAVEKGGIDLLWLTTDEPGAPRQGGFFTDDFGLLYDRYVRTILESLGDRLGGKYYPDVLWSDDDAGQIDGLIHSHHTLFVIECKASLLSQRLLSSGTCEEVREDLERKFVQSDRPRKGIGQLLAALRWLHLQRTARKPVRGIDLTKITNVIPMLVVADRSLRFPVAALWLNHRMFELKAKLDIRTPGRLERLIVCGTDDLEALEHIAITGGESLVTVLRRYITRGRDGEALWQHYTAPKAPHPRLDKILDDWLAGLRRDGVLPP